MSNISKIFRDDALQQEFDDRGYVVVDLLTVEDIEALTTLFHKFHPEVQANSFMSSSFIGDKAHKTAIRDAVYPIFLKHFQEVFTEFTYFGSSFLYKSPGKSSDVSPHQDWTIVDEDQFVAINIWTPLIDTNETNGTLYVVPESQYSNFPVLRAPTIPFYYVNYLKEVIKCSASTNARAGQAVILNQSLIHYSSPNRSDTNRIAITSGIKTKDAPMLFHYQSEDGRIERYKMPEDFLLGFENFVEDIYKRPDNGELLEVLPAQRAHLSRSEFIHQFGQYRPSFWDKVREVFR